MKHLHLLLSILCALITTAVFGGTMKGKVVDAKGEPLPYATIYVEGTTTGTNANGDGLYELQIARGKHTVICQYIGYKQTRYVVTINGDESVEHQFVLAGQGLEMKEAVIMSDAEDPAYRMVREAIKKRKFHLSQVKSFQTSIYLKGVMRSRQLPKKIMGQKIEASDLGADTNGKGVLYLLEEDADYYAEGDKERTVIHSVHQSGNPSGVGFSEFPPVTTFYENNVDIFGKYSRGYISPISDNALNYYKYHFLGQFEEQGRTIYKIQVTQKRAYEPCFSGIMYLVNDDWAIHSVNMLLTKQSALDRLDTLKINQLFLPVKEDTWVVKSQVLYIAVSILGFDINGSLVTVYNNQKVNMELPDSIFSKKITSSYDKVANKKDSSYWTDSRPIPLEADEKRDFVVKDSLRKVNEDPKRIDSIRRRGNTFKPFKMMTSGYTYSSKKYKNVYSTNSLLLGIAEDNIINFNPVEGVNIAPKINWKHLLDTTEILVGDVAARYGFSNTHFNAIGRLYYMNNDKEWRGRGWLFGGEAGKYVFQYNGENPVMPWFNSFSSLFYRQSDLRIYERKDAALFVRRNYGNGLRWFVKTSFERRIPLDNTTEYSFFGNRNETYKSNLPLRLLGTATAWEEHNAAIFYGSVSYKPGFTYTQYPDYKIANGSSWPRFTLEYEKGVPGIFESKTDFDKWRFGIQDELSLKLLGRFSYNFLVGGFLNNNYVSVPDLMHLLGNRGLGYAAPYMQSFQFAQFYDFSNKQPFYTEAHVEYHLNGLLSNKIPVLRQLQWYLLFGGNVYYAKNNDYYTEAFVGIDNIGYKFARFIRIDFVQSWDCTRGRNSGIRLGLNGSAFTGDRSRLTHSEW